MNKPPGLHRSMTKGDDGKKRYRPIIVKGPINPRARMIGSQVQSRIRREHRRQIGEGRLRTRRQRELGPTAISTVPTRQPPSGIWGWFLAIVALARGNRRPWNERRRREQRQAVLRASRAARPSRDLVRRASRAAGDAFQRKT